MDLLGELVRLRAPRPGDAIALLAVRSDPAVTRFVTGSELLPSSPDRMREAMSRRGADQVHWVVERLGDALVLGSGMLFRADFRNRNCWLALETGPPEQWGRGYGSEAIRLMTRFAFRQLGMEKVYVAAHADDQRAMRACGRAGYTVEAQLKRHRRIGDRLVTELWLAAYRDHPIYGRGNHVPPTSPA